MDVATNGSAVQQADARRPGGGLLGSIRNLDPWLHIALAALIASCTARYVSRHGLDASGVLILLGAIALMGAYAVRPFARRTVSGSRVWVGVIIAIWAVLTLVAPSFAWTAVPLAFAAMQVLPFRYSLPVVVLMTAVVSFAWLRIVPEFDPTLIVGPVGIALVTVMSFRALERGSLLRQRLLDELTDAQADLALAQRRAGALAERARLSREIHDSVGQGLTSINLHLQAADREFADRPDLARSYAHTASQTARESLDEVRRIVRDLAPAVLDDAESLVPAIQRVVDSKATDIPVEIHVHGVETPVPVAVAGAIVRTVQGALGNVLEHAGQCRVAITLTYEPDSLILDVRDDGRGFTPQRRGSREARGHGLAGIARRAESLGGWANIESAPGDGTTLTVCIPLYDRPSGTASEGQP
ncbi:sensor histidine kinase [Cumulibacter soli]|uniref:sensor histidine kinase n=1 Tax=Cumulibacter soli TaxID=2546344 RepID=UPI001067D0B7|nr:sensor histidine kinase [Cumulibacter soli]